MIPAARLWLWPSSSEHQLIERPELAGLDRAIAVERHVFERDRLDAGDLDFHFLDLGPAILPFLHARWGHDHLIGPRLYRLRHAWHGLGLWQLQALDDLVALLDDQLVLGPQLPMQTRERELASLRHVPLFIDDRGERLHQLEAALDRELQCFAALGMKFLWIVEF